MDRVDRLADLRDDVDRTAQQFEAAASVPGPFVGTDSTGCVSVTADRAGLIDEVRVTADWRSHLGVDEFAAAVMSAYQAAGIARVETWGAALAESADGPAPALRPLPWASWVADRIHEAWDYMCGKAQEFWAWITNIVSNMGDPRNLSRTASAWNTSVGGPVSAQVQAADAGNLAVDDTWSGTAADNYRQRIGLHKSALDTIKSSMTDGLSSALDSVKTAVYVFWGAVAAALTTLVAGIITAIGSTATVFGAPAGPFIAAGAIVICLTSLTVGGTILKSTCTSARNTLEQKVINENTGFLGGHWPAGALS